MDSPCGKRGKTLEKRTPEEEMEYRRYLRKRIRMRKRRRQVMIARTIVAVVGLVFVFLIFYGIGKLTDPLFAGKSDPQMTKEPEVTPFTVDVPEGYEDVYDKLYAMREDYSGIDDILLNLKQYPEALLNLLAGNPETLEFVSGYLMHMDDEKANGEITQEELDELTPPLFLQWDKRWGYVKYGGNIIAINGCGPTCMSMVYTGLTKDLSKSPAEIADFCIENDYYADDSGTSWSLMSEGAKKLGLNAEKIGIGQQAIQEKLESGCLVICSMAPGDFTDTGHFIVLRGMTKKGKFLINDPNSQSRSQKKWEAETVLKQVKAAWAYSYTQ